MRTGTERVWTCFLLIGLFFAAGAQAQKIVSGSSAPTPNAFTTKGVNITEVDVSLGLTAAGTIFGGGVTGPTVSLGVAAAGITNAMLAGSIDPSKISGTAATLGAANTFTANQNIQGNVTATGTMSGSNLITTPDTTALGIQALFSNSAGNRNTAVGGVALYCGGSYSGTCTSSGSGSQNTAVGFAALHRANNLNNSTAVGDSTLGNLTSGGSNIALGSGAGVNLAVGSSNIYIGNPGQSSESSNIRIGDVQTQTFVAGINGVNVGAGAAAVVVNSSGQLGTVTSSRRFKYDIQDMDDVTKNLLLLRPVTFHYKQAQNDGSHPLQYGLIAEEVADVYPELVQHDPTTGEPNTVLYHVLPAMLLNAFQKEHKQMLAQQEQIQSLQDQLAQLAAQTRQLRTEMTTLKAEGQRSSQIADFTPQQ